MSPLLVVEGNSKHIWTVLSGDLHSDPSHSGAVRRRAQHFLQISSP